MRYAGEVARFDSDRFYKEREDVKSVYDQQKGEGQDDSEKARVDAMNEMYGTNHKDLGDFTPEQFGYWHTQHHASSYEQSGQGGDYYQREDTAADTLATMENGGSFGADLERIYGDMMGEINYDFDKDGEGYNDAQANLAAMQLGIQGNLVQSAIDAQTGMAVASNDAYLSSLLMENTANLELRNTSAIMATEQQYGLAQMATQASLTDELASNQFNRDELARASQNTYDQSNMDLQSRLNINEIEAQLTAAGQNEQELQTLINSGALEQLVQAGTNEQDLQTLINSGALDNIAEQGKVDVANIQAEQVSCLLYTSDAADE